MNLVKLTESDVRMFRSLGASDSGKQLADYLRRFLTALCDIRNIKNPSPEKLAAIADISILLEEEVVKKIVLQENNEEEIKKSNEYV